jgi:hypothetical protein
MDFLGQALGLERIGREYDQRFARLPRHVGQEPGVARSRRPRMRVAAGGLDTGQQGGRGGDARGGVGGKGRRLRSIFRGGGDGHVEVDPVRGRSRGKTRWESADGVAVLG